MFTNHHEIITKSHYLTKTFLVASLLLLFAIPTNCFAKDSRSSSSSPSKGSEQQIDKTDTAEDEVEESQDRNAYDKQTVQAENYKRTIDDDAMVAAPAFGE